MFVYNVVNIIRVLLISVITFSKFIWYNACYQLEAVCIGAMSSIYTKNLVAIFFEQLLLKLCLNDQHKSLSG